MTVKPWSCIAIVLFPCNDMTPLQLAVSLKSYATGSTYQTGRMAKVVDLLRSAQQESGIVAKTSTITVSQSAFDTWNNLLFSEKFSDIKFICQDGTVLVAHKNVLAAASEYFANYFGGPWDKQHPDGTWKTSNSPEIMDAILTFVYTGDIPLSTVDEHASDLLPVAQEYCLPALAKLCEASLLRMLSISNIKNVLVLAHIRKVPGLLKECFAFVKRNASDLLVDPEFGALSTTNADLWEQLRVTISSSSLASGKKRKRND